MGRSRLAKSWSIVLSRRCRSSPTSLPLPPATSSLGGLDHGKISWQLFRIEDFLQLCLSACHYVFLHVCHSQVFFSHSKGLLSPRKYEYKTMRLLGLFWKISSNMRSYTWFVLIVFQRLCWRKFELSICLGLTFGLKKCFWTRQSQTSRKRSKCSKQRK